MVDEAREALVRCGAIMATATWLRRAARAAPDTLTDAMSEIPRATAPAALTATQRRAVAELMRVSPVADEIRETRIRSATAGRGGVVRAAGAVARGISGIASVRGAGGARSTICATAGASARCGATWAGRTSSSATVARCSGRCG